ncbi:putative ABC transporter permease [Blautia sp. MSJ-19]|uniref:putative ABC transporter permease n=1 Tax=Blautia sp. MSJ-19 TaxID=2841517 RepID=UPI001C0EBDD2|nr:putative ABC transporter permease [Blautia sp. MSJ-19]MBU5482406.1 putative ABC transporter permease [Blautia sp. MSJ-19]
MNQNLTNFFLCGSIGWCMEILWTGLHSLLAGQRTMTGKTSLLMFPIYGCAAIIAPLYSRLSSFPFFYRGLLYTAGFYLVEFLSGILLQQFHMCPWDYSSARLQYHGVIRLDYAPLWFAAGLIFEKILLKSS